VWSHYIYLRQAAAETGRLPPNTAPAEPQPGKRFAIIRTQANVPRGAEGFDSAAASTTPFSSAAPPADNTTFGGMAVPLKTAATTATDVAAAPTDTRKKQSFLSRMLSLSSGIGISNVGVAPAAAGKKTSSSPSSSTSPAAAPATAPHGLARAPSPPSSSDGESLAMSTAEASFVFKFILTWSPPQDGPPMQRVLARPRLPGPAHARLAAARSRAQSPAGSPLLSPLAASAPAFTPLTRTCSGSATGSLIDEARNALSPAMAGATSQNSPAALVLPALGQGDVGFGVGIDSLEAAIRGETASPLQSASQPVRGREHTPNQGMLVPVPRPTKPEGFYRERTVYIGRALAEWSMVVLECNTFVDRRRHEGVSGLAEVEVPSLGVNEFRRPF